MLEMHVLELRARCAALNTATLPADVREDTYVVAEAINSFEQVVHDVPQGLAPFECLRQHAHNLRNPLSAIIGFSQYMRDTSKHPRVAAVYRAANDALFTIDSLLLYARAKANALQAPMHTTTFDLVQLTGKLAQQTPLEQVVPADELVIVADRNQLEQVMITLAQTAKHIAMDIALLSLQPGTDDYVYLTFRFPSAADVASLAGPMHPAWQAVPGAAAPWEVGLCGVMPIVEGHQGRFEIVAVCDEVQFVLALPINSRAIKQYAS